MSSSLASLDATAQAALIRNGELTPLELVDALVAGITRLEPELHAVVHRAFEAARERARSGALPQGPLHGVPILMKDSGGVEAGRPCHQGMRLLRDLGAREQTDSFVTQKLKAAGCVSLGRTNVPELALLPTTEPAAYGPTANPYCPTHSPGGSSGGSAAAVAARYVAAAHGSDGGGSLRIPASMCGLVGLKPSRGRVSHGPGRGDHWCGLSSEGMLTRSVRDSALFLDILSGTMPGDPYAAPAVAGTFVEAARRNPPPLRIGKITSPVRAIPVASDCQLAVRRAAQLLRDLGHEVTEAFPRALDEQEQGHHYTTLVSASTAVAVGQVERNVGRRLTRADMESLTWALTERGRKLSAQELLESKAYVQAFAHRMSTFWDHFDLLLTPTLAALPPELGALDTSGDLPLQAFKKSAPYGVFTLPFNLSGQPAISLPGYMTADGLPVGYQLVAAYGREDLLLSVAAQVEAASPFANIAPALSA